jgi:hypothetical protein
MNTCSDADQIGVITSSVPLPQDRPRGTPVLPGTSSILRQLGVGDSVLLPRACKDGIHNKARLIGIRIRTRVDETTVRIWRIA